MSTLPILYINLTKDAERRQRMQRQFAALDLLAQRLPAVWWADLPPEEQARHHSALLTQGQYFKPLGNGEKGCYSSHLAACQQLLASDAPALAVFEDDVRLLPDLPTALAAIGQLPQGSWDMVKLYGRAHEKIASRRALVPGGLELITYRRVPSFAAGYVVSRAGARKLLDSRLPFGRPVDVDLRFWFENDLRIFGVYPSVIALDDTSADSSIWQAGRDRLTFAQRLRKLKMKLQLAWGNAWARPPHVDDTLPAASEGGAGANKA